MDLQKQIDYWVNSANDDLITSELLLNNHRILHGLFWCHLTIEKSLKANVVKYTKQFPPKTHNLIWLLEKTGFSVSADVELFIGALMVYQLEGRYPENTPSTPSLHQALDMFNKTKELHQWLMNKL